MTIPPGAYRRLRRSAHLCGVGHGSAPPARRPVGPARDLLEGERPGRVRCARRCRRLRGIILRRHVPLADHSRTRRRRRSPLRPCRSAHRRRCSIRLRVPRRRGAPIGSRDDRVGRRTRRPRRGLGAQHLGVGGRRARRPRCGSGVGTHQHPVQGPRGRLCPRALGRRAAVLRHRLPRHRLRRCWRRRVLAALDEVVVLRGSAPAGAVSFADFLARADAVSARPRRARAGTANGDDLSPTSCSRRAPPAPRKGAMLRHSASLRATTTGRRGRPAAGDRYLIVNPFFHSFGLKAGILASLIKGATMIPHAGVRRRRGDASGSTDEKVTMLPGPPAIYQTILNHPDLDELRPVVAATGGHRRGHGPRSR
jgi:hypothetical protein